MKIEFFEFLGFCLLIVNNGARARAVENSALNVVSIDYKCQPYTYEIEINQIDLDNRTFKGKLSLILEIITKTKEVNLDSKNLSFENSNLKYSIIDCSATENSPVCSKFCLDKPNSKLCEDTKFTQLCINNSSSPLCKDICTNGINDLTGEICKGKALLEKNGILTPDNINKKVTLGFNEEIENTLITVSLEYMGTLNTDMKGFYRSEEENGK